MKKHGLILVAIILFVVAVFSIPNTLAIFKNNKSSNDSLSVAVWNVSLNQTGIDNNLVLYSGVNTQEYAVKVTSNSEVDAKYSIVIGNLTNGVEVKLDNGNYVAASNGTVTFTNAGQINYSSENKENTHTLTFRAVDGTANVANRRVTVDVVIEQVM